VLLALPEEASEEDLDLQKLRFYVNDFYKNVRGHLKAPEGSAERGLLRQQVEISHRGVMQLIETCNVDAIFNAARRHFQENTALISIRIDKAVSVAEIVKEVCNTLPNFYLWRPDHTLIIIEKMVQRTQELMRTSSNSSISNDSTAAHWLECIKHIPVLRASPLGPIEVFPKPAAAITISGLKGMTLAMRLIRANEIERWLSEARLSFAMLTHSKLGKNCPAGVLPYELVAKIGLMVQSPVL
jgi:hypothetical protein